MIKRTRSAAARLGPFPDSGRVVPEWPQGVYRELLLGEYRIIYRRLDDRSLVAIVAVVHGRHVLPPQVQER